MERRSSDRVTVNLKAERISCTDNCSVFIENMSETGIYIITAPVKQNDYEPGKEIDLELELSTGDVINLNCNVKWSFDTSEDSTKNVGLEIIDPPAEYMHFIEKFY